MRVGGRAEWLLEPASPDELVAGWRAARERGFTPRILGGGANLLIEDGLHPGVVIATERLRYLFRPGLREDPTRQWQLREAPSTPESAAAHDDDDLRLIAWSGATLLGLVRAASDLGWSGLEGLAGVPGQVGGGVAMNAGGRWGDFWDVVESVRVLETQSGEVKDLARDVCTPRYRDGGMEGRIVLGAVLRFRRSTKEQVRAKVSEYLKTKRSVQPVTEWSAGCIFKNPPAEVSDGRSAGKLIDDCGAKGLSRGDAWVSPLHGNFIVNRGQATPADVLTLIEDVRDRVEQRSGVRLATEVKIWRAGG